MLLRPYCCSHYKSDLKHRRRFILATIETGLCLISALISGLYIVAIKKKYHTFMLPGLLPYIFDFYYSSKLLFMSCLKAERYNASDVNISTTILYIICLWVIGIQMAVFWTSYILYSQIRHHNVEKFAAHKLPMPK
ncbi:uncharacterized protein LOC119613146 isoform X2 [Lucilia sericata]|uniref:uncharacterized protein LOC119613146 isoform X2 n=1 Tax=Lucilia sericata TaxID=13632 RepID=UPI0018A8150E|nr:uncharacterized protein LOC119613146 isoform X2 [Lucilia sericata]